jgi:RNA polymerase sigma-70 factor (ECF subfamily)
MRNRDVDELRPGDLKAPQSSNPDMVVLDKERVERLTRAVDKELTSLDREIIILYYECDMTTAEITHITGTSEGNVRKRLSLARAKLREILNSGT